MIRAEGYSERKQTINGYEVKITNYRVGPTCHCTVANVNPGANIARGKADTPEEAEEIALSKARQRIK